MNKPSNSPNKGYLFIKNYLHNYVCDGMEWNDIME